MRGVNRWIGIGNLTRDPEVRATASGDPVANITIACNESYKDRSGQKVERAEFVNVVFFGRLAEIASQYLRKGGLVYIEGALRTRKWQGQDGQDRYTTEIVAREMQMLDGRKRADSGQTGDGAGGEKNKPQAAASAPRFVDDVPF